MMVEELLLQQSKKEKAPILQYLRFLPNANNEPDNVSEGKVGYLTDNLEMCSL